MTREEELDWLCRLRSEIYVYMPEEWLIYMNNALDMAIKALEQEPKTGHWVRWCEIIEKEYCTIHEPHCKCSECNREYEPYIASLFNYCPNCGAKMQEVEE